MSFFIYFVIAIGLVFILFGVLTFSTGGDKPLDVNFNGTAAKEMFKFAKDNNPVGVKVLP